MNKAFPYMLSVLLAVAGSAGSFYLDSIGPTVYLSASTSVVAVVASQDSREMMTEDFLLRFLFPDIAEAVEEYYGWPKQFMSPSITDIKRLPSGQYNFEITVQVITFEGPHNPPYGLETITMTTDPTPSSYEIRTINYRHEDVLYTAQKHQE